jgi:hypothetical protein
VNTGRERRRGVAVDRVGCEYGKERENEYPLL